LWESNHQILHREREIISLTGGLRGGLPFRAFTIGFT
jgi:hypothetical protein